MKNEVSVSEGLEKFHKVKEIKPPQILTLCGLSLRESAGEMVMLWDGWPQSENVRCKDCQAINESEKASDND